MSRIVLVCLLMLLAMPSFGKEVTVHVRVDDIFSINSPIMPREINGLLSVAEKHDVKIIIAAIPLRLNQSVNEDGAMAKALLEIVDRGHEVVQHGLDHQCKLSGRYDREFSSDEALEAYTQEERLAKIFEGRRLLETVLGPGSMKAYVGPGDDDNVLIPMDGEKLYEAGFLWLKEADSVALNLKGDHGTYPTGPDFGWALTEEKYDETLAKAKEFYRECAETNSAICIKLHDPFTRAAYENGVVLRLLDDLLTWMESEPEWEITYTTYDQYYEKHHQEVEADPTEDDTAPVEAEATSVEY